MATYRWSPEDTDIVAVVATDTGEVILTVTGTDHTGPYAVDLIMSPRQANDLATGLETAAEEYFRAASYPPVTTA